MKFNQTQEDWKKYMYKLARGDIKT
jgi:hypothetical protein